MCGIAGILAIGAAAVPPGRDELQRMIGTLRHRGPDGNGVFVDGPVGLAHARLSIIDLATGDQPMADASGDIQLVFNGEIFNYVELRQSLQAAGHVFRTTSDTETIIHAYVEHGDAFVQQLNGQFAFALWDRRRQRLILARDRAGIRPLFHAWDGGRLLFGSEIKAIAAVRSEALRLDAHALAQIFTFWTTVGARSPFEGISTLPAGHMMLVEAGGTSIRRYWDWTFPAGNPPQTTTFKESAVRLRGMLVDAVRLQLRADVPVGAYLSGGLDSSGIAALIRNYTNAPLRTFSLTFEDAEFDESEHQQEMARHLGTDHTSIRCGKRQIGEEFPRFLWHAEAPVLRTAPVPLMILSGLVRQSNYKVVLTGEGADEVFAGYDVFKEGAIRRFWARQPASRWRPLLFGRLYPYLRHSPVSNAAYVRETFGRDLADTTAPGYAQQLRWRTTGRLWGFFSPEFRDRLAGVQVQQDLAAELPVGFHGWGGLQRDQYVESRTLLEGYLLSSQGDRVAMANSVEGRFPFLDHHLIEFANGLPARFKLQGLHEKAILRAALEDLLPPTVAHRVKQPYRAPDSASFFVDSKPLPYVESCLDAARIRDAGYFDAGAVRRLFDKCRASRAIGFADNMAFVGIVSTMLLHDMFARRSGWR